MNTNIVVSLDTRRIKQDGTFPLVLRLGHQRKTIPIPIGISIKEKDWDNKNRSVKKSYIGVESVTRLNNLIQKKRSEAMETIVKLNEEGLLDSISIADLKNKLFHNVNNQSFFVFTEKLIEELKKANQFGTAKSYHCVKNVLKTFNNNKDLLFNNITYQFLNRFEINHLSKGNTLNGLSVYLRAIRSIYNKAIKEKIVDKDLYPFNDFKIKSSPTEKRALDLKFLEKIFNLKLQPSHPCFDARNYFVTSYMMYGINFKDMALLKKTDIKDGRIQYCRKKTNRYYDIKVTDNLKEIFTYYSTQTIDNDFIFPIVKRQSPVLVDKDISWARLRYNKKLKQLAKECNIEQNLTSYVSRHSFATQAMLNEVPLNAISTMLGHSNYKTTEIYLKSLPSKILDDYNAKILPKY